VPRLGGVINQHAVAGGAGFEGKTIEVAGVEGGFKLVGIPQPRQVLTAGEVGGGGVGDTQF
jgi:hypothetical protein